MTGRIDMWIAVAAVAALALSTGCKKGDDCDAAVGNFMTRIEAEIDRDRASDEERKLAKTGLPGLREQLLVSCRDLPWSDASRRCVQEAATADQLEACDPFGDKPASK